MRASSEIAPPPEFREASLQGILSYALEVYKENARVAAALEDKAQKTAAIAGVFIGACLAFARGIGVSTSTTSTAIKFLIFAVACLIGSVIFSVTVMKVKSRVTMLPFDGLVELIEDAIAQSTSELAFEVRMNLRRDQITAWKEIIVAQQFSNEEKALQVLRAQALLILAVLASAVSTLMFLFGNL